MKGHFHVVALVPAAALLFCVPDEPSWRLQSFVASRGGSRVNAPAMKSKLAFGLIGYGVVLAVMGLLVYQIDPEPTQTALITGVAGGALSVLLGALGLVIHRGRGWAIFVLVVTTFALLSQSVVGWMDYEAERPGGLWVQVLITTMFGLSIAMVAWLAHADFKESEMPRAHAAG